MPGESQDPATLQEVDAGFRAGGWRSAVARVLVSSWWPMAAAVIGMVLVLPSLGAGWNIDDYIHRAYLLNSERFPWDLYAFLNDGAATIQHIQAGDVPWWTLEELHVAFLRPIASLTQWLDYRLWPDHAWLMHAQSIAWFGGGLLAAGWLLRQVMGPTLAAGIAIAFLAVEDAHYLPVAWLANRNVLPAFLFGMLALVAHDRWRRGGWRWGAVLGPLGVVLSLASAEAGLATLGYVTAHVIFLDRARWRQRLLALLPYVIIMLAWRVVYAGYGYGTWGSGFYTDPASEPFRFAGCVAERGPILLLAQFFLPPMPFDGVMGMFGPNYLWTLVAVVVLGLTAMLVVPVVRNDRAAAFWATGMVLAIVPVCATIPMTRLLLFAGVGGFGLIGCFLSRLLDREAQALPRGIRRRSTVGLAVGFVVIHGLVAPLALVFLSREIVPADVAERIFIQLPMDEADVDRTLMVVNAPSPFHARHSKIMHEAKQAPFPRVARFLSATWTGVTVERAAENTLVVQPDTGYLKRPFDTLFRGAQHRMPLGTKVQVDGIEIEITALTADGRPAEATFRFDIPLDDPGWLWLCYRDDRFEPFIPPPVGEQVRFPEPAM